MTAQQIIDQARTYLNVRWQHQGRSREGCDCVGLLASVGHDLGLAVDYDTHYHHKPDLDRFLMQIAHYCDEVPKSERGPGDFLLFFMSEGSWHLGIQGEDETVIHSTAARRKVVEHGIDQVWAHRLRRVYRLRGLRNGG
jgi:cell wall-associated NlpC family hydrolase